MVCVYVYTFPAPPHFVGGGILGSRYSVPLSRTHALPLGPDKKPREKEKRNPSSKMGLIVLAGSSAHSSLLLYFSPFFPTP